MTVKTIALGAGVSLLVILAVFFALSIVHFPHEQTLPPTASGQTDYAGMTCAQLRVELNNAMNQGDLVDYQKALVIAELMEVRGCGNPMQP